MLKKILILSFGLLVSASVGSVSAHEPEPAALKLPGATLPNLELLAQQTFLAVLKLNPDNSGSQANSSSSSSGDRIVVVVDGMLVELPLSVVEAMIRNGTFTVVWAGSEIPKDEGEYPCWLRPDLCEGGEGPE